MNDPFLASYLFYDEQRRRSREAAQRLGDGRASVRPEPARAAWYRAAFRVTRRRSAA